MFIRANKHTIIGVLAILWMALASQACSSLPAHHCPTAGWPASTPEAQGLQSGKLAEMMTFIQENQLAIDSITIIRNGRMVLDAYYYPFRKHTPHIIHACTKSITSTAVGIALDQGHFNVLDQPVLEVFGVPPVAAADARKQDITLKHLLTMSSGLETRDSSRHQYKGLYEMMRHQDWVQYVLDRPVQHDPGTRFDYSHSTAFMLSAAVQEATGENTFDFLKSRLFAPLGISNVRWRDNPKGISVGYGEMWLTPHDMAKIGQLYLNKGQWCGRRIVSQAWVEDATRKHIGASLFDGYGYQWWVSSQGYYTAVGREGQYIIVIPRHQMVVVFTSALASGNLRAPANLVERFIMPAAVSDRPLPGQADEVARLQSLVDAAAQTRPYVWRTRPEGVARDGRFTRTAAPAFTLRYPVGCRRLALHPDSSSQVMSIRTMDGIRMSAHVSAGAGDVRLADFGPNHYAPAFAASSNSIRDMSLLSNRVVALADNTPAFRTEFNFKSGETPMKLVLLTTRSQNQLVFLATWGWTGRSLEAGMDMMESLTLR